MRLNRNIHKVMKAIEKHITVQTSDLSQHSDTSVWQPTADTILIDLQYKMIIVGSNLFMVGSNIFLVQPYLRNPDLTCGHPNPTCSNPIVPAALRPYLRIPDLTCDTPQHNQHQ